MKKVMLGAALCSAAVALASPANADATSDFWAVVVKDASELLIAPSSASASSGDLVGSADADFLSGSTNALILGATGVPTPDAAYISDATKLYLDPNGYDGTTASTLALTTPETSNFDTSVAQGETILENAILADYQAGDMGCDASGVCSDPLTIFTYSQSSAVAALAENQLADDKIPTDALRFVMLGANPTGVPDNLYPTEIYDIHGDTWAEPGSLGTTWQDIVLGMELHEAYLGLTPAEIDSATSVVEGMTTFHDIPTLTTVELWEALLSAATAGSFSIS
ncbi:MAG TPA: PE-PPE domain-containing protein [Planctomycetaceae bacterium]